MSGSVNPISYYLWLVVMTLAFGGLVYSLWVLLGNNYTNDTRLLILGTLSLPSVVLAVIANASLNSIKAQSRLEKYKSALKSKHEPQPEHIPARTPDKLDIAVDQDRFDKMYSEVVGADSEDAEPPEFDRYYDSQNGLGKSAVAAQIAKDMIAENEKRKQQYYGESSEAGLDRRSSPPTNKSISSSKPRIPYDATEEDYLRLQKLLAGRAQTVPSNPTPRVDADGSGAIPSTGSPGDRPAPSAPVSHTTNHPSAPHSTPGINGIEYSSDKEVKYGNTYFAALFEEEPNPIIKIRYMTRAALRKFNQRISKPHKPVSSINTKKDAKPTVAQRRAGYEAPGDSKLRERIEELKRGGGLGG